MVVVGTGGRGTRFIKTNWPITEGLTLGTTKLKTTDFELIPQTKSNIPVADKVGL